MNPNILVVEPHTLVANTPTPTGEIETPLVGARGPTGDVKSCTAALASALIRIAGPAPTSDGGSLSTTPSSALIRNAESTPTSDDVEILPIVAQGPSLDAPASTDDIPSQTPTETQISYSGPKSRKAPISKKIPTLIDPPSDEAPPASNFDDEW